MPMASDITIPDKKTYTNVSLNTKPSAQLKSQGIHQDPITHIGSHYRSLLGKPVVMEIFWKRAGFLRKERSIFIPEHRVLCHVFLIFFKTNPYCLDLI